MSKVTSIDRYPPGERKETIRTQKVSTVLNHLIDIDVEFSKISQKVIKNMAKECGIARLTKKTYPEIRIILRILTERIIKTCEIRSKTRHRNVINVEDVLYAFQSYGRTIIGYEP